MRYSAKKNRRRSITCTGDDYKVSQLRKMLKDIDYDNNPNWSHAILKSGSSKGISLDAGAIELLIDYYTNTYIPIEESTRVSMRRRPITANFDTDADIVMYFNGKRVFKGIVYDLTDTIERLCKDPVVHEKFQEWCNSYGDPFDFDGTPRDTAYVFCEIIEGEMDYYDGDPDHTFYASGQKGLDFEIFYADQEVSRV